MAARAPHVETRAEELVSSITHGVGIGLSIAAAAVMVTLASLNGGARHVVTVSIFGASLLLLYLASTIYHACRNCRVKHWMRVCDHSAIYVLIAGTYTPFLLVTIRGGWGWSLFGVLWGLAAVGCVFKLYYVHRFEIVSTLLYVLMGWVGVIAVGPFLERMPEGALWWVLWGGLSYTGGLVFFLWDHLPFNHAIWHLFVIGGSVCHFFAVVLYVVPG